MRVVTRKRTQGFTLVELLVVITIIGVLATLIIANFSTARARARDARRKNDLQQIKTALRLYYNDFQRYPQASSEQIRGCGSTTYASQTACNWGSAFSTSAQEYMKQIPTDPLNNSSQGYVYSYASTGADSFTITARLENASDADSEASQRRCGVSSPTTQVYMICAD